MYQKILIRLGELSTKGKNKMTFIRQLARNIENLTGHKPKVDYDRIYLEYSEDAMEKLKYVFGIFSYSPVIVMPTNLEDIEKSVIKSLKKVDVKTFKVAVRRNFKQFEKTSQELNGILGGLILDNFKNAKVDVKKPELKVEVEIREKESYLFFEREAGLGGYPVGIGGRILHLMSGGIDSPIAAFLLMKRGMHVDFLNFVTPPHTDKRTIDKVNSIIKYLMKFQGETTVYRSNYTDIMHFIGLTSNQAYKITLMRRSFYRIATTLAYKNKYKALSNGENLGQVASQTIESINVISSASDLPIFRPLLTYDKLETINFSKKIGLYELSISKCVESCEFFAPKAPIIKPSRKEAERLENELEELLEMEKENIKSNIEVFKIKA